jgi:hypothetical protein
MLSQFYVIAALYALHRIFKLAISGLGSGALNAMDSGVLHIDRRPTHRILHRLVLPARLVGCVSGRCCCRPYRATVLAIVRRRWPALATGGALAVLAIVPLCSHYIEAAAVVGMREWRGVEPMLPRPQSWIYLGAFSRLYRWQSDLALFRSLAQDQEHRLGVGLATTLFAGIGLYRGWKVPGTRLFVLVAGTLALSATVPVGEWIWRAVFAMVPGASAIRAVARIGMLLMIPVGIGVAYFVDTMSRHRFVVALVMFARSRRPVAASSCPVMTLEKPGRRNLRARFSRRCRRERRSGFARAHRMTRYWTVDRGAHDQWSVRQFAAGLGLLRRDPARRGGRAADQASAARMVQPLASRRDARVLDAHAGGLVVEHAARAVATSDDAALERTTELVERREMRRVFYNRRSCLRRQRRRLQRRRLGLRT